MKNLSRVKSLVATGLILGALPLIALANIDTKTGSSEFDSQFWNTTMSPFNTLMLLFDSTTEASQSEEDKDRARAEYIEDILIQARQLRRALKNDERMIISKELATAVGVYEKKYYLKTPDEQIPKDSTDLLDAVLTFMIKDLTQELTAIEAKLEASEQE